MSTPQGTAGNGNAYIRFLKSNNTYTSLTDKQCGYKFIKTSGSIVTSATNADGTTETATNVTPSLANAMTSGNVLHVVSADGTNLKYYNEGTLLATHTTNLPPHTATDLYQYMPMAYADNASTTDTYVLDYFWSALSWEMY